MNADERYVSLGLDSALRGIPSDAPGYITVEGKGLFRADEADLIAVEDATSVTVGPYRRQG